ncbi:MAG: hypothetical protein QMD17_00245 [Rhodocyclaceae bacterium]|jgi:hypothetical protein|nr:hypothetical protein [Rhodocyclaceae bacterium]
MRQIHDLDVIILLATTLASKRRPAQLVEIVAAADLLQGVMPFVEKLGDAIRRLAAFGLISVTEEGYLLTPIAQELMAKQPKKAGTEELVITIKSDLAAYNPTGELPPIQLAEDELSAAIQAHKAAKKVRGQNLLMPKPKIDRHFKVEGRWRRASGTRQW